MLDEIRKRLIESDLSPHDLRTALEIIDETIKTHRMLINNLALIRDKYCQWGEVATMDEAINLLL